jgi:succinyl-diaminopimelate desuccinylase
MEALRVGDLMDQYRTEMVANLQKLVRITSVRGKSQQGKPFGEGPSKALAFMLDLAESWGLEVQDIDGYAGHVDYGEGQDYVAALVHLDVVPEGVGWTFPPYGAEIHDNIMYGRGVSDNKAPAMAALYAIKALQDAKIPTKRKLRVIFGCAEETGMEDMTYYFQKQPLPFAAFAPDVSYPPINREKGILHFAIHTVNSNRKSAIRQVAGGDAANRVPDLCTATVDLSLINHTQKNALLKAATLLGEKKYRFSYPSDTNTIKIETFGKAAHGAEPELGENAIISMASLLTALQESSSAGNFLAFLHQRIGSSTNGADLGVQCEDSESGSLSLNVGLVSINKELCEAIIDIRYPVTANGEQLENILRKITAEAGLQISIKTHLPPLYVKADHPLVQCLRKAYRAYNDCDPEPEASKGGTYARVLHGRGVAFGGVGINAHKPDEQVAIDELMHHSKICAQAMYEMAMLE